MKNVLYWPSIFATRQAGGRTVLMQRSNMLVEFVKLACIFFSACIVYAEMLI